MDAPLLAGNARFEVHELLGSGAMGDVYRATDKARGTQVAIKVLRRLDARSLLGFKSEFRAIANLTHPNILQLYDLIAEGDEWLLVMELVTGTDFLRFVRPAASEPTAPVEPEFETFASTTFTGDDDDHPSVERPKREQPVTPRRRAPLGPLNEARLRSALQQLASGLHELHQRGFVHRDLKPDNVLVFAESGRVVIGDFGLVVRNEHVSSEHGPSGIPRSGSSTGDLAGTLAFMAPEQGEGSVLTGAADWYAVGVMLYLALTQRVPIDVQKSWDATARAKREQRVVDPRELNPDAPPDLSALAMQLLAVDPAQRAGYARVRAVVQRERARLSLPTQQRALLIGRQRELGQLRGALQRARAGQITQLTVSGPSGMGKSAVIDYFLQTDAADAIVWTARCHERESLPFKAFDALIDAMSTHLLALPEHEVVALLPADIASLAHVFPILRRVPVIAARTTEPTGDLLDIRQRAAEALFALCRGISRQRPLVLYVDDLQWGDLDSAVLFARFQAATEDAAILWIGAFRSEDQQRSPLLAALRAQRDRQGHGAPPLQVTIEPLGPDDARALASFLLGAAANDALLAQIVREALGSPFFLHELAVYVREHGLADAGDELKLERVVTARIARLDPACRLMLELVSVAGRPERRAVLEATAELGAAAFPALHALQGHHLVLTSGDGPTSRVQPYHDRIREATYEGLSTSRRVELHRRLAEALERESDAEAEALFRHWKAAGDAARAAHYAVVAATSAERALAFLRAAELYAEASALASNAEAAGLQARRGQALVLAGHAGEAAGAFEAAAGDRQDGTAQDMRVRAAIELLRAGQIEEGLRRLGATAAATGVRLRRSTFVSIVMLLWRRLRIALRMRRIRRNDAEHVPSALAARAERLWWLSSTLASVDFLRGNIFSAELTLCATDGGGPRELAVAYTMEAIYAAANAQRQALDEHIARAREAAAKSELLYVQAVTEGTCGIARMLSGDWVRAREMFKVSQQMHRSTPMGAWDLATMMFWDLAAATQLGDVRDLVEQVPDALRDADRRGDLFASTYFRTFRSIWAWLGTDQPERAREELTAAARNLKVQPYQLPHYYITIGLADLELYEGRIGDSLERIHSEWRQAALLRTVQHARCELLWLRGKLCLARATAQQPSLLRSARKDAAALRRENVAWAHGNAALLEAGIAASERNPARAESLLREAIQAYEPPKMKLHAAVAQLRLGELLANDEGTQLITRAEQQIRDCGIRRPDGFVRMLAPGFPLRATWSPREQRG